MFHPAIFCCSLDKGFPAPTETAGLKFLSQKAILCSCLNLVNR
jgi:hypothetical protein